MTSTTVSTSAPMTAVERDQVLTEQRALFAELSAEWNEMYRKQGELAIALRNLGAYIVRLEGQS